VVDVGRQRRVHQTLSYLAGEFGAARELDQSLFIFIENNYEDVLIAELRELDRLLEETSLTLAEGGLPGLLVGNLFH